MPIFEVTNPQGKKYRVNAPEGATQDDAIRYIATQQQPQQTGMFGQPTDQPRILQDGEGSDFTRGLFTYTDQYGGILGGAQALAGKAIDSDEQIMKGLERMEESEAAVGRRGVKKTDSFTGALEEGVGAVLTEYIPFIAGQGVGMIGEAFLTATAGAMVGSAAAPGAGTATGALTGLVAKNLVKKGIMESAKQLGREEGKELIKNNLPIFGICLGHQILALTLGAKTKKMILGHRGANHPVKNLVRGNVEITSQNHGFEVVKSSLSKKVQITHQSLFDNSIEGIRLKNKPVYSVQYHPESNPGPQDSVYLFEDFVNIDE